jgi:hypothetical protein
MNKQVSHYQKYKMRVRETMEERIILLSSEREGVWFGRQN